LTKVLNIHDTEYKHFNQRGDTQMYDYVIMHGFELIFDGTALTN